MANEPNEVDEKYVAGHVLNYVREMRRRAFSDATVPVVELYDMVKSRLEEWPGGFPRVAVEEILAAVEIVIDRIERAAEGETDRP